MLYNIVYTKLSYTDSRLSQCGIKLDNYATHTKICFLVWYICRHAYYQVVALHANFRPCVTMLAQFTLDNTHTCSCCVPPSKI